MRTQIVKGKKRESLPGLNSIKLSKRPFFISTGLLVILVLAANLMVRAQVTIQTVVPGIRHIEKTVPEFPWAIHILEIDLKNPYLFFETVKAKNRIAAREKTTEMVHRTNRKYHHVVAAINGDFFAADGTPINLQISRGELVRSPTARSVLAFDADGNPLIAYFHLRASVLTADKRRFEIDDINTSRQTDQLIFYNRFWGESTKTNQYGTEILLRSLKPFFVNDSLPMVVERMQKGGPPIRLGANRYVLSGHNRAAQFLQAHVSENDTLILYFALSPGKKKIVAAVGGLPRLLENGRPAIKWEKEGASRQFAYKRHPRTSVGFNASGDTLYLVTVDGRQEGYSVGMSLFELTELMQSLGCTEAINLDGGGSTTMVIGDSLVNRPSDAEGERPVANAFMVISTAPWPSVRINHN